MSVSRQQNDIGIGIGRN